VEREYVVTVRGRLDQVEAMRLVQGVEFDGQRHCAAAVRVRKASGRETHLMVTLTEGRNREIRKLCEGLGHQVTRLHRIRIGGITLDTLAPRAWRIIAEKSLERAFPGYSEGRSRPPDRSLATRRPRI
jgi:23S rRNA pseudouridine2605 synthase